MKRKRESRSPRVAVLILNFNGIKWLKICVPSVMRSVYPNLDVYVIDNGSNDDSQQFVRTRFPTVRLITFGKNLGFAEAYNQAITKVDAEYLLLLNNDTSIITRTWVELLVRHLKRDRTVAGVGCKLVTMDDMDDRMFLDSVGVMGIKYWRGFVDIGKYEKDEGQYDHPPTTPFSLCGAAMLLRKNAFESVHGFDSKFYAYTEDVDVCWRLRLVGFRMIYEPAAIVAHYHSGSRGTRDLDPQKLYFSHRNLLRAILKNCGSSTTRALRNYLLFTVLLSLGFAFFEPRKAAAVVRAVLWNILNLKDTYTLRLIIQRTRQIHDEDLLNLMFPRISRYQPVDHSRFRSLLDTLFEVGKEPIQNSTSSHL